MAQALLMYTKLQLSFETGLNEKGEPVFKTRTYSNVKETATPDQLFLAAQAIASLSTDPLASIIQNNSLDIVG